MPGEWRVIAIDLRGRGGSGYDPDPANYTPPVYVADILKMLDQLGIADAVFVGTSLGGLCTMLLAATDNERIAGALLNDIGPVIDQAGIDRIGGYVGQDMRFASWDEADRRAARAQCRRPFPIGARASGNATSGASAARRRAQIRFDYDMAIAENFHRAAGCRRATCGRCIARSTGAR